MIASFASLRSRRFALLLSALAGLGLPGWLGGGAWITDPAVTLPAIVVTAETAVESVERVALTVSDLDRSIAFYRDVLDFELVGRAIAEGPELASLHGLTEARVRLADMELGDERIRLMQWVRPVGRPAPSDGRGNDLWFQHVAIIVSDMDRAYEVLRSNGVPGISDGPQRLPDWNPNAGGIRAYYFRDPDGHPLEILWFPAGKGALKWQHRADRTFLGIDHTAIAVRDTDASLRFYGEALGLRVAGESLNYGIEQERLSGVAGARVRITGLRAADGPGVEFLDYLMPENGRPASADQRPNDLVHWQTVMAVADVEAVAGRLAAMGGVVSNGIVAVRDPLGGEYRSLLAKDPDGHFVQLVEAARPRHGTGTR